VNRYRSAPIPEDYRISELAPGIYYVRTFNNVDYPDEVYDNISCANGCEVVTGTAVPVASGSTTPNIDFGLSAGGHIEGTVTDATTGQPVTREIARCESNAGARL
jgi:hypothetical protein